MSSIVIQGDTSGSITVEAPSVAGTHTLTLPKATSTIATTDTVGLGQKNLIINGDMRIDQRNSGSAITAGGFMVDRWQNFQSQASKWTSIQQVTDAPTGATHSVKYTSASAYTVGAADYFTHEQKIEGNTAAHLGWGASGAKTVTLSFYVKSSLTGTFGGALYAGSGSYGYPFEYTISSANTWEKKTITIEGPTSGTFNTDNSASFSVCFGLGIGTDYSWTAGSWQAQVVRSATSATSVVGTSGATWQISLVQLEVGENATPFENRMYGTELALCQRYFQYVSICGTAVNTGEMGVVGPFRTEMRATPGLYVYTSNNVTVESLFTTNSLTRIGVGAGTVGNVTSGLLGKRGLFNIYCTGLTSGGVYVGSVYVSAEL